MSDSWLISTVLSIYQLNPRESVYRRIPHPMLRVTYGLVHIDLHVRLETLDGGWLVVYNLPAQATLFARPS